MAGDNFLFYITCKRGRLFLEGDSFKYCWLSFPSKYFVIFAIKLKNNHSKETEHGLSQRSKFGSLYISQYISQQEMLTLLFDKADVMVL